MFLGKKGDNNCSEMIGTPLRVCLHIHTGTSTSPNMWTHTETLREKASHTGTTKVCWF